MSGVGRCATCRYWYRDVADYEWGLCARISDSERVPNVAASELAHSSGTDQSTLDTHESFGCVEHTPKDPA